MGNMLIISSPTEMQRQSLILRAKGKKIGFVPTMGYLHEGHMSLLREARSENDILVVSIFVNPAQFGPKDDLVKYPRDYERDKMLVAKIPVDFLFHPATWDMYPGGFSTYVEEIHLSEYLCGPFRPGHFKGVTTIVLKLFNIIQPHNTYFGQKDAQQALILRHMARDLNLPLNVMVCPTVREPDGLAMSSRNSYLSSKEREDAVVLWHALNTAKKSIDDGIRDSGTLKEELRKIIAPKASKIDYISIVDAKTLEDVVSVKGEVLIALAVYIGSTRLIDNIIVKAPE
jgi:pantoate--beta-alanine ligase